MKNVTVSVPTPSRSFLAACLIAGYVIGWFLTYGYTWNRYECTRPEGFEVLCGGDRIMESIFTALIWPMYWSIEGAKAVTR